MRKLDKATRVLAKVVEVAHWIGAVSMLVGLVLSFFDGMVQAGPADLAGESLACYGFEAAVVNAAGQVDLTALRCFCAAGAVILSLMAMVFRNIYLIMKKSENDTPFQKDNVRMVREIGIFMIAVPLMGLAANILLRVLVGADGVETSEDLSGVLIGLVVLCLSRIFARGVELEADADGLV